ncbi:hypothetical protein F8C67_04225 [Phaeocystidibacter luteus]|uniref:Tetratricopeptide repeat protein n=2 Tax=Phaeocystidibacter luteus TaxID=911197 RepID=A0A6N6RHN5_9FLAO|nr:hypothetical protein F8C67_04225 [Phaeocystidibacter luteus]
MNMKMRLSILISTLLISATLAAQTYKERFDAAFYSDSSVHLALPILRAWESASPNDPEMLVSAFNFYFHASQEEVSQFSLTPPSDGREAYAITDSAGNSAGYMYSKIVFDEALITKGLGYINRGIELFPKRLDMHFGKAYVLYEAGMYQEHVAYLEKILELDSDYNGEWLWSDGQLLEGDQEQFFTESFQDYLGTLATTDAVEPSVAEGIILKAKESYPENTSFANDLGVLWFLEGDLEKAEKALLEAYDIDETDEVTLGNLGYLYLQMSQLSESKSYYEKLLTSDDSTTIEYAKAQIQFIGEQE